MDNKIYKIKVKYSNNITILSCDNESLFIRLHIVLNEKNIDIKSINKESNSITINGLILFKHLEDIVSEQFNSDVVELKLEK